MQLCSIKPLLFKATHDIFTELLFYPNMLNEYDIIDHYDINNSDHFSCEILYISSCCSYIISIKEITPLYIECSLKISLDEYFISDYKIHLFSTQLHNDAGKIYIDFNNDNYEEELYKNLYTIFKDRRDIYDSIIG